MSTIFNTKMMQFQEDLQKQGSTAPPVTVSSLATEFAAFKSFVVTALAALQKQVELLSQESEKAEMRSRRKFLLLHGVQELKDEVATSTAVRCLTEHIQLPLTTNDISQCFRLGQASKDKPRPLLVKFRDVTMRGNMWNAKTKLKGTGVTLSEFLTKSRHNVFMAARQRFGIAKCWTRDGIIFVVGADEKRYRITSLCELDKISNSTPSYAATTSTKPEARPKRAAKK